jgi:trehalose/maltose hydrolase-like predicted phosphorylase
MAQRHRRLRGDAGFPAESALEPFLARPYAAERHIGSAIALNVWRYWEATRDDAFMAGPGIDLIVGIVRFWAAAARSNGRNRYDIAGVVGPDEFHTTPLAQTLRGLRITLVPT